MRSGLQRVTATRVGLQLFGCRDPVCLTSKVLFKLPLRQTTGMVAGLLKMANLDRAVPDYTTLCRRQKTLAVQIPRPAAPRPA